MIEQPAGNWGQPLGATPPAPGPRRLPVEFTGDGGEYFRIWIVNLLLTIVTIGIYSAWAKVRRLQYFYRNTRVDGAIFDYHGKPLSILKGRIITLVLLFGYQFAFKISIAAGIVAMIALAVVMPWLFAQSQRFRLHNSSYRGLRFRFHGTTGQAYALFGVPFAIALVIGAWFATVAATAETTGEEPEMWQFAAIGVAYLGLMLFWPWLHYRFKRYQHGNAAFGSTRAEFFGRASSFYAYYGMAFGMLVVLAAIIGAAAAGLGGRGRPSGAAIFVFVVAIFAIYATLLAIGPFLAARVQNHVWSHTRLGPVSFESAVRARRLIWIVISNLILIMLTMGLFSPFAAIRAARYKLQAVTVVSEDDLGQFVGEAGADVAAIGEGAADLFDVDFAL